GQSPEGARRFMALYSHRLQWEESEETLKKEQALLEALLSESIAKSSNFPWIPTWINASSPEKAITLKEFWGGSVSAAEEIRVEPAYTISGKGAIDSFMLDLESALANPATVASRKTEFLNWYRDAYCEAWHVFGLNFSRGMERLKGSEDWRGAASKAVTKDGLYFLLLKRMADELKPFNSETRPDWMRLVYEFEKTQLLAAQLQTGTLAKATETASKLKEKIQEKIGKEQVSDAAGQQFDAARALSEYQGALNKAAT